MADDGTPQTAVTWVYEHSKHTGNVYQVLRTLAIAYAEQGACLSVKEIAEQTRVSQTTVRTALKTLEQDGTIEVIKNGGTKRRNGVTNCYRLVGFAGAARETPSETRGTPSYSTTPSYTPTQRSSTTPSYTPPANPEDVPVYVSDAAGEKDLSLSAKTKSKKITPLTPQGDAPDGASVVPSKPKRERKAPEKKPPDEGYLRLRRGVAMRSWGIDPKNPAMKGVLGDDDYGRIGLIVSWLRGLETTPETLADFYAWYKHLYPNASAPKDLGKFKEHFAAFVQAKTQPISHSALSSVPAYALVQDRERLRADEIVDLDNYTPELIR